MGDDVILYPAHGPGSACGKNIGKETFSTLGEQKKYNYALQQMTREDFIAKVTDGIPPPPQYFFEDARINKTGYEPIEEIIKKNQKPLTADQFLSAVQQGAVILDTRNADDFEKGHIKGSVNIGLNGQFAVWVGTLIDITKNIVLITEAGKEYESILRLARVGYEKVLGYLQNGVAAWPEKLEQVHSVNAEHVREDIRQGVQLIDVRKPGEWNTSHIKGARFVPLSEFPHSLSSLDKNKNYIVYCGGGYRSMTAISIMKNYGFRHLTNIYGGFGALQKAGLEISTAEVVA